MFSQRAESGLEGRFGLTLDELRVRRRSFEGRYCRRDGDSTVISVTRSRLRTGARRRSRRGSSRRASSRNASGRLQAQRRCPLRSG